MKTRKKNNYPELRPKEAGLIKGGRLWPFFNLDKLLLEIMYGEDLFFKDLFKQ